MARSPIERCRAGGDAPAQTGPGPAIAVRVHVRARRAFTTAGWRKMVARVGAAARLGFQGPPAHVAARLVAFSLPTRTPTGAPCRRISASHPRASRTSGATDDHALLGAGTSWSTEVLESAPIRPQSLKRGRERACFITGIVEQKVESSLTVSKKN
jgi:hypothetical protein